MDRPYCNIVSEYWNREQIKKIVLEKKRQYRGIKMKKRRFVLFGIAIIFLSTNITVAYDNIFAIDELDEAFQQKDLKRTDASINRLENNFLFSMVLTDDGWISYPTFPNYAPNGIPDFDQKQNNWKDQNNGGWVFCGAVAFANVLWYLDCMYSDPNGSPGDGIDICPIVVDYNAPSAPDPGPHYDDHNFNNVNDLASHWDREEMIIGNELIEKAAWYCDTQGIRSGKNKIGTCAPDMHEGATMWFQDCGLSEYFEIRSYSADLPLDHLDNPDNYINENLRFEQIANHIIQGHLVNIIIKTYRSNGNFFTGHFVTIAGINVETGEIAYSDPYRDMEQYFSPSQHNDAAQISHDIYETRNASPSFEVIAHGGWTTFTTLVDSAVIIIPPKNGLPTQPLKPMKPQGQLSGKIDQEYEYITTTTHPLDKNLYYLFDWGDGTDSGWIGPYESGEECTATHIWNKRGAYNIRVKAKDTNDIESPWSDPLGVSMPKNKATQRLFPRFQENYPILFRFLQRILYVLFLNEV